MTCDDVERWIVRPMPIQRVKAGQIDAVPDIIPCPTGVGDDRGDEVAPFYAVAAAASPASMDFRFKPAMSIVASITSSMLLTSTMSLTSAIVMSG